MNSPQVAQATHPSRDDLKAFGLGKLDPSDSDTLLQHLETCDDCRRVVADSSGDNFLVRIRAAQSAGTHPARSVSGLAKAVNAPTGARSARVIGVPAIHGHLPSWRGRYGGRLPGE